MRQNHQGIILAALAFLAVACNGRGGKAGTTSGEGESPCTAMTEEVSTHAHLSVDRSRLMRYVTCTPEAVDSMLHAADSIHAIGSALCLDSLWLTDEQRNREISARYKDTVAIASFMLVAHEAISRVACDKASALLVWHEAASAALTEYLKKGEAGAAEEGRERVLQVAQEAIYLYDSGAQAEMNAVARYDAVFSAYRLSGLYKQVMDMWPDQETTQLVHDDYSHIMSTWQRYLDTINTYYSMLPLQMEILRKDLLDGKAKSLAALLAGAEGKAGSAGPVIRNLREHRFIDDKGQEASLSDEVVRRMAEESYVN